MIWSPQQDAALEAVRKWLDNPGGRQIFRLFGYAGTGKTTLAIEIANMVNGTCKFATFTGKAALVMSKKGCHGASTIHSLIYKVREDHLGNPRFVLDDESTLSSASLLIIDECSMVNDEIGEDLLSFEVPILVLGDPAQLPPVAGAGFFTEGHTPDVMLTEIHRQADGNPIIHLATIVRKGERPAHGNYKGDNNNGAVSVIARAEAGDRSMLAADQIICGTNAFRKSINGKMRGLLRSNDPKIVKLRTDLGIAPLPEPDRLSILPVVGDRVICLKNKRDRGIFNGGMFRVRQLFDRAPDANKPGLPNVSYLGVDSDDVASMKSVRVQVPHNYWEGTKDKLENYEKKHFDEFDYAYAITCHKSQGSQWDKVFVYDDGFIFKKSSEDMPRRWLYTAITRAADKLIVAI